MDGWIPTDRGSGKIVCSTYGLCFGGRHVLNHCAAPPGLVQTNDRAELQVCIHALEVAPRHVPLQTCVDSQLVTDGVTLWLPGWNRRKWRSPVANRDLWQDLHALLQDRQASTEWIKVLSHVGLHGNGMADELADLRVRMHGVRMQGQEQQGVVPQLQGHARGMGSRTA